MEQKLLPTDRTGSEAPSKNGEWKKANVDQGEADSWSEEEVSRGVREVCRHHGQGERKLLLS